MFDTFLPPEILQYLSTAFSTLLNTAFIWLPILTLIALFNMWVGYRRAKYWQGLGSTLLEIKIPRDVYKSPKAMEVVLGTLHQTADESNWYWKYWRGQTRSWFSLEIASMGGNVRFFIWCRNKYRSNIESHIYSQYPGVEVYEAEDYTKEIYYDRNKIKLFGCEWALNKPDPYPIKTYIDYGLDKDPKEEYKVDPLSTAIEFLGSITSGHNVWIQIIVRAHKKEQRNPGNWFSKTDAWKDEAEKEIKSIIKKFRPEEKDKQSRQPTEGEKETIAALERSISKFPFDVGIRTIYIADVDKYNSSHLGGMLGMFKQFSSVDLNGFKSSGWSSNVSTPLDDWLLPKDFIGPRIIEEYKLRRFFFSPYKGRRFYSKPIVLNAEELATIYHFPGKTTAAPTLERIPSKKSEAPSNLPT